MSGLVGHTGPVTMAIRPGHPGEVELTVEGHVVRHVAFGVVPIAAGEEALVVGVRGPLTVDVEPWSLGPGS